MSATPVDAERTCPICGESLDSQRSDAGVCGSECRRIRTRVRRLLAGERDGPYANLLDYGPALGKRAKRARQAT